MSQQPSHQKTEPQEVTMADSPAKKSISKSEFLTTLADATELSKKQIAQILDELANLVGRQVGKKGPGIVQIPGLVKIKVIRKPATKERPGINPFTKEPTIIKAKPARNVVKVQALKALKEMV
jgi:nucleoid DNA-binding protein